MKERNIFASLSAKGVAKAEFTSVGYSATIRTTGATGPEAKSKGRPIIAKLMAAIEQACKDGAGIDQHRLKTDYSVSQIRRYNSVTGEHEHLGYQAVFTVGFIGTNIKMATRVHDALTSIEGVESPTPAFSVDENAELEAAAFADGFGKAEARFKMMCETAGLDRDDCEIVGLDRDDERAHHGKTLALSAYDEAHADGPVEIEPGKAEYGVIVRVTYARNGT